MENIYELKQKHNRIYILPDGTEMRLKCSAAIVLYLYYKERLEFYSQYIDRIPADVDLYIVSSRQEMLDEVASKIHFTGHISFVKKPNTGRDISALLVTMAEVINKYEYVCFLHDKKEHRQEEKADTDLWIENIWGNLCGSSSQINQILGLFEKDKQLGVLAPPDPVGDHFCTWFGYGWHGSFDATKALAKKIGINAPIEERFPPITIGTALWFRTDALKKLFDFGWKYEDFDDSKLSDPNYFCYGVERIFAYVAQDAEYETGEVMSLEYARKQTNIVKKNTMEIYQAMQEYFPFPCVYQTRLLDEKLRGLFQYVSGKEKINCDSYNA